MSNVYLNSSNSSSSSTSSSSNLIRVPGMSSGLDTDSLVKSMVSNYQTKIDKASQDEQTLQWKQAAYRDIIKGIKGLQDYFDPLSSKYILSDKSLNINTATSDQPSIASGIAGSTAKVGTYKVNVNQLASQAKIDGSSKDSLVAVKDLSKWSGNKLDFGTSGSITLSNITDTTINDTNMSKLAADINKQIAASSTLNGKISASYVSDGSNRYIKFTKLGATTDTLTLSKTNSTVSDMTNLTGDLTVNSGVSSSSLLTDLGFSAGAVNFKLTNGTTSSNVSLTVGSSSTVQDLINGVKSATNGAVTMDIDDVTGKISFKSKSSGSAANISISDSSSTNNVITKLGISTTTGTGTDAIVSITAPGQSTATTTTQSSNVFTMNGVSYNLVNASNGTDANITVTSNADTVVSNIKNFITDYNTIISTINTKLTEKKDSAYPPLTDAQKQSMSDSQITAWETKAKVGILRNDDYLNSLMTQLRGIFSAPVYSNYDSSKPNTGQISLSFGQYGSNAIGIDTSSDVTDGGKLVITDENQLKSAIQNNLDDFKKLFTGASNSTLGTNEPYTGSKEYMEDGIFKRMDTILRGYVAAPGLGEDGTYTLSGSMNIFVNKQYDYGITGYGGKNTLPDQVYSKTLSIKNLKTQMSDAETRYYNRFTALETALSQLSSQQSSLSSMLGTSS